MFRKNLKKGFSLVELLVVITIIAIMSVVAYTAVGGQTIKARDARRQQDLGSIQSALELYFNKNYRYPEALSIGNEGAPDYLIPKTYLSAIPKDPSGKSYIYKIDGDSKTYEVAATLEVDGLLPSYKTYVVGNGIDLAKTITITVGGVVTQKGKYLNGLILGDCADGRSLTKEGAVYLNERTIGTSDADGKCIPYDPKN